MHRNSAILTTITVVLLSLAGVVAAQADGNQIYQQNCAVCHGDSGQGVSGPPLAGNQILQNDQRVVNQILNGGQAMPPFASKLSDEEIASVATLIRTSWGNSFGPITAEQVTQQRSGATPAAQPAAQQQAQAAAPAVPGQEPAAPAGQAPAAAGATPAAQPAAQSGTSPLPAEVTIGVATGQDGSAYLVDGEGRTVYRFLNDALSGTSHCYAPCTTHWLPVLAGESVSAGEGLTGSTDLGLVARQDQSQSQQVSYRGWPLYYYVGDTTAGEMGGTKISGMFVTVSPEVEGTGNGGTAQGGG